MSPIWEEEKPVDVNSKCLIKENTNFTRENRARTIYNYTDLKNIMLRKEP